MVNVPDHIKLNISPNIHVHAQAFPNNLSSVMVLGAKRWVFPLQGQKKPLSERAKEVTVKGIDKVQAALGQATDHLKR
jgi:hypothetical protein